MEAGNHKLFHFYHINIRYKPFNGNMSTVMYNEKWGKKIKEK